MFGRRRSGELFFFSQDLLTVIWSEMSHTANPALWRGRVEDTTLYVSPQYSLFAVLRALVVRFNTARDDSIHRQACTCLPKRTSNRMDSDLLLQD